MKRTIMIIALLTSLLGVNVYAEKTAVAPKGVYAEIDTTLANKTIKILTQGSDTEKTKAIAAIKEHPEKYAPPVFYVLSHVLFADHKEEAMFWFYAGQLRIRYDANRCADESAVSAAGALSNQFGPLINQYAFKHIDTLKKIIPKVIKWDEQTPHEYDHRWINLYGMGAFTDNGKNAVLSKPKKEWDAIAKKTRADYLAGFNEAMKEMSH